MLKTFKILLINILILAVFYQIAEFSCFLCELKRAYPYCANGRNFSQFALNNIKSNYLLKYKSFDKNYEQIKFRKVEGEQFSTRKPIVIFGCSYAYGASLEDEQTFSYKLSKYLSRKVYNRAYSGWGPQDMLYQVRRADFYNTVKEEPAAIIYVFMDGHLYRTLREVWTFENQVFYDYSNDKLIQSPFSAGGFLYGYLARKIRYFWAESIWREDNKFVRLRKFLSLHFISTKEETEKHWKNTKYYILVYCCNEIEKQMLDKFENNGFEVIYVSELTNENILTKKYQISDTDMHPNEKAWDLLTPLIAQKLNLE